MLPNPSVAERNQVSCMTLVRPDWAQLKKKKMDEVLEKYPYKDRAEGSALRPNRPDPSLKAAVFDAA
jgi:hypothetical protein